MILGTGYERKTHIKLLEGKGIAEMFGLETTALLREEAEHLGQEVFASEGSSVLERPATPPSMTSSGTSSGTSLGTSLGTSSVTSVDGTHRSLLSRLNITRNYRLVSKAAEKGTPRIYLQGCSEATHGISESLLSVVSVRAGEILGDILEGYNQ